MRNIIDTVVEPVVWFGADWSLRWAVRLAVVAVILWITRPRRTAVRQLILLAALTAGAAHAALGRRDGSESNRGQHRHHPLNP